MKIRITLIIIVSILISPTSHILPQTVNVAEASSVLVESITTFNGGQSFNWPAGIDHNDSVIAVANAAQHGIVFFNLQNEYLSTFKITSGPGNFSNPYDVVLTDQYIGIVDYLLHVARIFDKSGNYQFSIGNGTVGTSNEQLNQPEAITANSTHFFIADTQNNRVQIFDINGVYSQSIGVNSPTSVALNGTHIFIVSSTSHRVFIYNNDGSNSGQHIGLSTQNADPGALEAPHDVSFDPIRDFIYVSELTNQRVSIFKPHPSGLYFDFVGYVGYKTALDNPDEKPYGVFSNGTHVYITMVIVPNSGNVKIYKITEGEVLTSITTEDNTVTLQQTETQQTTTTQVNNLTTTNTETEIQPTTVIQQTTVFQTISDENSSTVGILPVMIGFCVLTLKMKHRKKQ